MFAWMLALTVAQAGDTPAWQRDGWGFGGLPAVNFNSDEGLGLGALASIYRYDGKTSPYKFSSTFLIFATTRGVHAHRVDFDALKLARGRLRLSGRVQMDISRTNPFCGTGRDVSCDPTEAEDRADALALTGEERDTFVRRYYLYSYVRPNLNLTARYRVGELDADAKTEVFGSWRAMYYLPGTFDERVPVEGTKYAQFIDGGDDIDKEMGFLSSVQLGAMYDTRDFEPAPGSGIWAEASLRGAAIVTGSDFDFVGFNTTVRNYVSLVDERRLVFATRGVLDGLIGDAPRREMAELGGSQIYNFGGGLNAGRGIRQRRFVGRAKGMLQNELRFRAVRVGFLDVSLLAFSDLLFVAERWSDLGDFARPVAGEGAGLRLAFDDSFIIRADVGFSAAEDYSPSVYIDINNLF